MRPRPTILLHGALCLGALAFGACSGGSSDPGATAPFQFRATGEVGFAITVARGGLPLGGASVSIVETWAPPLDPRDSEQLAQGDVWFEGGSDDAGSCTGIAVLPTDVAVVDVIVHEATSVGPYTDATLRERLGPFAPSARITVAVDQLAALTVDLEAR